MATDCPETILVVVVAPSVSSGPSFFDELEDRGGLFPQVLRGARVKPTNLRRHRYVREHLTGSSSWFSKTNSRLSFLRRLKSWSRQRISGQRKRAECREQRKGMNASRRSIALRRETRFLRLDFCPSGCEFSKAPHRVSSTLYDLARLLDPPAHNGSSIKSEWNINWKLKKRGRWRENEGKRERERELTSRFRYRRSRLIPVDQRGDSSLRI